MIKHAGRWVFRISALTTAALQCLIGSTRNSRRLERKLVALQEVCVAHSLEVKISKTTRNLRAGVICASLNGCHGGDFSGIFGLLR